ncbi:hypothetical protein B0H13DRAFT_1908448 [Mycena leptocephala]|nr:hypothetical protein B0H13DRAFT_1908448 [Mycena leptocephala]
MTKLSNLLAYASVLIVVAMASPVARPMIARDMGARTLPGPGALIEPLEAKSRLDDHLPQRNWRGVHYDWSLIEFLEKTNSLDMTQIERGALWIRLEITEPETKKSMGEKTSSVPRALDLEDKQAAARRIQDPREKWTHRRNQGTGTGIEEPTSRRWLRMYKLEGEHLGKEDFLAETARRSGRGKKQDIEWKNMNRIGVVLVSVGYPKLKLKRWGDTPSLEQRFNLPRVSFSTLELMLEIAEK